MFDGCTRLTWVFLLELAMSFSCTRCGGLGFLNVHQIPVTVDISNAQDVLDWIAAEIEPNDVSVCDCCGDGLSWYGTPGEHYNADDPQGERGPYASNGGLCGCH